MRIIAWLADDILDSEVSRMEITLSFTRTLRLKLSRKRIQFLFCVCETWQARAKPKYMLPSDSRYEFLVTFVYMKRPFSMFC
jgi:hypothetical protein